MLPTPPPAQGRERLGVIKQLHKGKSSVLQGREKATREREKRPPHKGRRFSQWMAYQEILDNSSARLFYHAKQRVVKRKFAPRSALAVASRFRPHGSYAKPPCAGQRLRKSSCAAQEIFRCAAKAAFSEIAVFSFSVAISSPASGALNEALAKCLAQRVRSLHRVSSAPAARGAHAQGNLALMRKQMAKTPRKALQSSAFSRGFHHFKHALSATPSARSSVTTTRHQSPHKVARPAQPPALVARQV